MTAHANSSVALVIAVINFGFGLGLCCWIAAWDVGVAYSVPKHGDLRLQIFHVSMHKTKYTIIVGKFIAAFPNL